MNALLFRSSLLALGVSLLSTSAAEPARPLPPADFTLSPYTGYTRAHWLEITEQIIAGAMPWLDPVTGMPALPENSEHKQVELSDAITVKKEALERILTAVIFYTTATGRDTVPGYAGSLSAPFVRAIARGLDPSDPAYWGLAKDYDQVGSILALAAYLNPRLFWDPYTAEQKRHLLEYLQRQTVLKTYNNNHHYFHMVPASLLEREGYDAHRPHLTAMFQRLLGWYRGDGWFIDGSNGGFDHYNAWGFQLYNGVLYRFDEPWRQQFGEQIRATTGRFLSGLPWRQGRDGGPIPLGRSLCYRFADNAAIGWAVLNHLSPLPPGQARRLASGSLKYFWDHGCLNERGLLSIGYHGENAVVGEFYSSAGSPYWATQAFACLLIPAADPFWTDREEPIPADGAGGEQLVPGAQSFIRVSALDGEARLYPVGQPFTHPRSRWESGSKYDQHAYSSSLGYCLLGDGAPDIGQGRTGYSADGITWGYREHARPLGIAPGHLVSAYYLTLPDQAELPVLDRPEIITHTLVGRDGEVHVFWHRHPDPLYLHLGGYGIQVDPTREPALTAAPGELLIAGDHYRSQLTVLQAPPGAVTAVTLAPRAGWSASHLFGGRGAFPQWRSSQPVPPHVPVVVFVNGTRDRAAPNPAIEVRREPGRLLIKWDGTEHIVPLIE